MIYNHHNKVPLCSSQLNWPHFNISLTYLEVRITFHHSKYLIFKRQRRGHDGLTCDMGDIRSQNQWFNYAGNLIHVGCLHSARKGETWEPRRVPASPPGWEVVIHLVVLFFKRRPMCLVRSNNSALLHRAVNRNGIAAIKPPKFIYIAQKVIASVLNCDLSILSKIIPLCLLLWIWMISQSTWQRRVFGPFTPFSCVSTLRFLNDRINPETCSLHFYTQCD